MKSEKKADTVKDFIASKFDERLDQLKVDIGNIDIKLQGASEFLIKQKIDLEKLIEHLKEFQRHQGSTISIKQVIMIANIQYKKAYEDLILHQILDQIFGATKTTENEN